MKTKHYLLLIFIFYCFTPCEAQLSVAVLTAPQDWSNQIANLGLQVNSAEFISVKVEGAFSSKIEQIESFEKTSKTFTLAGQFRILPFGSQIHTFSDAPIGGKAIEKENNYCYFKNEKITSLLKGFYLAAGIKYTYSSLNYSSLDTAIKFPYNIKMPGLTASIGYQIQISRILLGSFYQVAFNRPKWEGGIDIFQESLYTHIYPFKYRFEKGLHVELGINF